MNFCFKNACKYDKGLVKENIIICYIHFTDLKIINRKYVVATRLINLLFNIYLCVKA